MTQLFSNNTASLLENAITTQSTGLAVSVGTGVLFPTIAPASGDYFYVTLYENLNGVEINHEIVKVVETDGDNFVIQRGQDGTIARNWAAGTPLEVRIIADAIRNIDVESVSAKQLTIEEAANLPAVTVDNISSEFLDLDGPATTGIVDRIVVRSTGDGGTGRGTAILMGAAGQANSVDAVRVIALQNALSGAASAAEFRVDVADNVGTLVSRLSINNAGLVSVGTLAATGALSAGSLAVSGTSTLGAVSASTLTLGTDLAISEGGTGASTAAAARTNLDVYSKSESDGRYVNSTGTVTLTGDVAGSGTFSGDNVSIAATIQPNSVALGTDTTGNYVADVNEGAGIVVTGADGEGAVKVVAHADTSAQASVNNSNGVVIQDVGVDGFGHVTSLASVDLDGRYYTETEADARFVNSATASVTLTGDVTGTASFTGDTVSVATTIAPNSVALGTDTTGDYVGTASTSGKGIAGTATGEGSAFVVSSNATEENLPNTIVYRDLNGDFAANEITASVIGNATTATTLETARTISLSGDVAGSVSFDGSANANITATIQPNSVALGTDTTGNYASAVTAGAGITVTGAAGEGTSFAVAHADTSAQASVNNAGNTVIQDITLDTFGHITGLVSTTITNVESANTANSATTATTATNATNAANVQVDADNATNATHYPVFSGSATGNNRLNSDTGFIYNPSTNTLTVANFAGNASTATKLQTARTISLAGDVTGSTTFDGSANATITATIAANSVALGTDTTGNYIATGATSGNGISGSATGEGATFTVTSNATEANTPSTIVFRDLNGDFSAGVITASLDGNATSANTASTADTWTTARTLSLTGDVTGSVSINGGANVSLAATIAANSVALGTDTTGNYVADVNAGSGIVVGGADGEGAVKTVSHADTSAQASVNNSGNTVIQDITLDTFGHITGLVSATINTVTNATNATNVNVTTSAANASYPFVLAPNQTTGQKALLMDSSGGTYNPSTNLASINITGSAGSATAATNQSGGTVNATTITGSGVASFAADVFLGDAGTDTTTLRSQLSVNSSVGTTGQVLASRGTNQSPEWVTIPNGLTVVTDATNANRFITFTDQTSGAETQALVDTGLTYNPSTNTLTTTTFAGNATTASRWTTSRNITLAGDASGSVSVNGATNVTLTVTNNNATTADRWTTPRSITLEGDVTGTTTIDGSADVTITATVNNAGPTEGKQLFYRSF